MELDSFLASPRWDILRIIADKPSSPLEIAASLNTTISFISQQLKLLEAAGLVKRKRTGEVEKGKPRSLFSLSKEVAYVVPLAKGLTTKKMISLSRERKIILKIWQIEDQKIQRLIEKFFWQIEEFLDDVEAIIIYEKKILPKVYIVSNNQKLSGKLERAQKDWDEKVDFQIINSFSNLSRLEKEYLTPIYDTTNFSGDLLKGGIKKDE